MHGRASDWSMVTGQEETAAKNFLGYEVGEEALAGRASLSRWPAAFCSRSSRIGHCDGLRCDGLHCERDWLSNHRGNTPLGMSERLFPGRPH